MKRASLADVAARAGVSAQTVSRVARGEDSVRPATAERVRAAMNELDYVPNRAAQALRYGSFRTVGIVGHRLSRTGEAHIIEAVTAALRPHGYTAMLVDVPANSPDDFARTVANLAQAVDGLVVLRLEIPSPGALQLPPGLPAVLSDSRYADGYTSVGTDQAGGTQQAVEHLLSLGHRTVHHVSGPTSSVQAQAREKAWVDSLWNAGRAVPPVQRGDWTPRSGYEAGRRLADEADVTAVFCGNDEMAQGLLRAFAEAGRRVPDDVSVVGFDDVGAEWLSPPLTTVAQDFTALGAGLVDALLAQLAGPDHIPAEHRLVTTRLVVRASTAAPRGQ